MSEMKMLAGPVPSQSYEGEPVPASLLASGGFLATLGVAWLIEASPIFGFNLMRHSSCARVCVQVSPLYKDSSHVELGGTLMTLC